MERGSDRLALITGQIQTLPSSSSSPDLQPSDSHSHLAHTTIVSPDGEDKTSSSVLPEDNHSIDTGTTNADFGGSIQVPPLSTSEINPEAKQSPASEGSEPRSSLVSSTDRSTSVSTLATETHAESQTQNNKFFTPSRITSALAATETTRLFCSIAVALLVVLSYLGFPILGSEIISSILSFRPLYLVLLTNVTVVLAQLLDKQRSSGRDARGENKPPPASGNDWAEQLGKTLELGLLIQKVADAVFMDCAVYAVIVVCGVSFAWKFR